MSSQTSLFRETETRITEDHLRIRALLDGIHRIQDPHVLLPLLREMKGVLDDHFTLEEGVDGLYSLVSEFEPDRAARVETLLAEHHQLMGGLDALIVDCNSCINGPLARIKKNLDAFYSKIQDHDASETEMLTDVLLKMMQKDDGKDTAGQA